MMRGLLSVVKQKLGTPAAAAATTDTAADPSATTTTATTTKPSTASPSLSTAAVSTSVSVHSSAASSLLTSSFASDSYPSATATATGTLTSNEAGKHVANDSGSGDLIKLSASYSSTTRVNLYRVIRPSNPSLPHTALSCLAVCAALRAVLIVATPVVCALH